MKKHPIIFIFFSFIIGITFIDILKFNSGYSEVENRNLARRPKFSKENFLNGEYISKYETYVNDNFLLRDKWINLKSMSEFFLGKLENNNIIYGKESYMFDKVLSYDRERFERNMNAINEFIEEYEGNITTIIAPNSYTLYKDNIPWGMKLLDQEKLINEVYSKSNKDNNIELVKVLNQHTDSYIYYKTDHHWTSYGAYLAYEAYIESLGEKSVSLDIMFKNEVNKFYGTYFSKSKKFNAESDILTYYDTNTNITIEIENKVFNGLYDYKKLNTRDKYSIFIRGNNGLSIIKNSDINSEKKLLIFKDSFANSMIPFLSENFKEIHVVDLRSFPYKVSKYMENTNFDEVLILYNLDNFLVDSNIPRIKY